MNAEQLVLIEFNFQLKRMALSDACLPSFLDLRLIWIGIKSNKHNILSERGWPGWLSLSVFISSFISPPSRHSPPLAPFFPFVILLLALLCQTHTLEESAFMPIIYTSTLHLILHSLIFFSLLSQEFYLPCVPISLFIFFLYPNIFWFFPFENKNKKSRTV